MYNYILTGLSLNVIVYSSGFFLFSCVKGSSGHHCSFYPVFGRSLNQQLSPSWTFSCIISSHVFQHPGESTIQNTTQLQ